MYLRNAIIILLPIVFTPPAYTKTGIYMGRSAQLRTDPLFTTGVVAISPSFFKPDYNSNDRKDKAGKKMLNTTCFVAISGGATYLAG